MTRLERREIRVSKANLGKTALQDGFPGGSDGKESAYNEDRPGFDAWVGKILWRRERLPPPLFWILQPVSWRIPWTEEPGPATRLSDFNFTHFQGCLTSNY